MLNTVLSVVGTALDAYEKLTDYPYPIFRVEVDGVDISPVMASRLMSLSIKDNRGLVVDSVDIELNDADGMLSIPPGSSGEYSSFTYTHPFGKCFCMS